MYYGGKGFMRSMKKRKNKKRLYPVFWLIFALGVLWLAFVPPRAGHKSPYGVTVPVHQEADKPATTLRQEAKNEQDEPPAHMGEEAKESPVIAVPLPPESGVHPAGRPRIAILIDDIGPNLRESQRAVRLPPSITLALLPYATRVKELAREGREAGHELMLHMPMEPMGKEDPGPDALITSLPMRDLQERFERSLAGFGGYDGVNNHMGSRFTAWPEGMEMVMDALAERGLFFLDSRTSAQSLGKTVAEKKGVPALGRDVFLDDDAAPSAIRAQLALTEKIARRKGAAIAIGHPHVTTLAVLEAWIPEAQARGFDLVPVNALLAK